MKPEELSLPALAIYTELRDSGELIPEEEFTDEFPDADYEAIVNSLKNEGLYPEPASNSWGNSNGVLFKPGNRSTRYSLKVH